MSAIVEDARFKLNALLVADLQGSGDMGEAIKRLAKRFGMTSSAPIKALRYRPPKGVEASLYLQLCAEYEVLRGKVCKANGDEQTREAPKTLAGRYLVGLAAALDRANFGPVDRGGL